MFMGSIKKWFEVAVPTPTDKNRSVQIGCHFEEVAEMLDSLLQNFLGNKLTAVSNAYKSSGGETQNKFKKIDKKELLDSLCDQIVTAIGVAHMFGMNIEGALEEVNRSNWSKFVDGKPVFDTNGKIAKPPTYSKPNLETFVENK